MLITTSLCHMFCWCSRIMRLINNFFQVAAACALVMFGAHWVSGRRPGCSSTQKVSVTEVPADLHLLAFFFPSGVRTSWPANNICTCLRPLQSSKSRALFGVSHFPFQKHSRHRAPAKLKVCFSWQQTGTDTLQQLIAGTEVLAPSLEKRNRSRTQTHRRCKVLRPTGVTSVSAFAATLFPFGKTAAVVCLNTYYMSGITRCCVGGGFLFFSSTSSSSLWWSENTLKPTKASSTDIFTIYATSSPGSHIPAKLWKWKKCSSWLDIMSLNAARWCNTKNSTNPLAWLKRKKNNFSALTSEHRSRVSFPPDGHSPLETDLAALGPASRTEPFHLWE